MKSICIVVIFVTGLFFSATIHADKKVNVTKKKLVLFKNKAVQKEIYYKVTGNKRDPFYPPGEEVKTVVKQRVNFTPAQFIKSLEARLSIVVRGPKPLCLIKGINGKHSSKRFTGETFNLILGSNNFKVKIVEIKDSAAEGVVFLIGKKTFTVHK